jgi:hypothetical protein
MTDLAALLTAECMRYDRYVGEWRILVFDSDRRLCLIHAYECLRWKRGRDNRPYVGYVATVMRMECAETQPIRFAAPIRGSLRLGEAYGEGTHLKVTAWTAGGPLSILIAVNLGAHAKWRRMVNRLRVIGFLQAAGRRRADRRERRLLELGMDLSDLRCPLTLEFFVDPVVVEDGHTYERTAIERWLQSSNVSPLTRQPISWAGITLNISVRRMAENVLAA